MVRSQWILLVGALVLFAAMLSCPKSSPQQAKVERSRNMEGPAADLNSLAATAKSALTPEQKSAIEAAEQVLSTAADTTAKAEAAKKVSGLWYQANRADVAALYAVEVANLEKTAGAWEIAGANLNLAATNAQEPAMKTAFSRQAAEAFQNAASLEPSEVRHKINLALVYVESPPQDNPMKGILMLRDLDTQFPNNPAVLTQLGRLAIKTGQWEKAIQRLEAALKVDPKNDKAACLLAEAYKGSNQPDKAKAFEGRCR